PRSPLSSPLFPYTTLFRSLDLAPPRFRLVVREHPYVGADAGVVEELVRQRDDGLQPVVLDDPPANLALARARVAGEQRRAVEDRSEEHTSELQSLAYLVCR